MEMTDMRCFLAAVDAKTFRAAARRVGLSPTAFGDRIRHLEEHLGCTLFHRTSRTLRLSEAGRRLEPHARTLLTDFEQCRSIALGEARPPLPYELTIGTRHELGISWLAPMLEDLEREHPERVVHLYIADTPDLVMRVKRGDIDAVVFSARITSPHLAYSNLHVEEYTFVGTPDLHFDGPWDAPGHTLVDISPDLPLFRYLQDSSKSGDPWNFGSYRYMGGIAAARYLVRRGQGVGVLPAYFVRDDLARGALRNLLPSHPTKSDHFRLVWRTDHPWQDRFVELARSMRARPIR